MKKRLITSLVAVGLLVGGVYLFSRGGELLRAKDDRWSNVSLMTKLDELYQTEVSLVETEQKVTAIMGGWRVIFSKTKDQNLQIRALQEVTGRLRMDAGQAQEIDLRFDKVIVRKL